MQNVECTELLNERDDMLGYVLLELGMDDEKDHTDSFRIHIDYLELSQWFSIEPFFSIEGCLSVGRGNYPISCSSSPVRQRLYMNRYPSRL